MDLSKAIPVIDAAKQHDVLECKRTALALETYGCFALKLSAPDFLTPAVTDMLVRYFRQPDAVKDRDVRKEFFYQVGRTPPFVETARDRSDALAVLRRDQLPTPFTGADPKERFFAAVGPRPEGALHAALNMPPVIPEGFPEWEDLTTEWGGLAILMMFQVAEMAAVGFGMRDRRAFTRLLQCGPHLFAPTGTDLSKYGKPGTVIAGWHDDLNFLSVHGKANFPGLRIWLRNGTPVWVKVPHGCLLVQAGQQFEHLTGGRVLAGLHEVVATEGMHPGIQECLREGVVPWRVSTTMFGHVATDNVLEPLEHFATPEALAKYPPMTAGDQVLRELRLLGLAT